MSHAQLSQALEFCFKAFTFVPPEEKDALFSKLKTLGVDNNSSTRQLDDIKNQLTPQEAQIIDILQSRRMVREDPFEIESFTLDAIDGLAPRLERGRLGLARAGGVHVNRAELYSPRFLDGKVQGIRPRKEDAKASA
ncbi:hypothetical protein CDD81_6447 [Ophiocordyceps australis]|uniref:Uncharacterized protein n=1 Tax=Ophiocordyceps australis TaxID=1399860 RepID=A0A2C5YGK0_9HYPO|nr:hypothetical protein CDD81_6447 [Ophiocordyceps australis]